MGLQIQESILTGESVAVEKQTASVDDQAALGDRVCMGFSGTTVTYGQGMGVVVATGGQHGNRAYQRFASPRFKRLIHH